MTTQGTRHRPRTPRPSRRYGIAQLSLIEHALCPLDTRQSLQAGLLHSVGYDFTDKHRNRKSARASVACPFGLSPNDELYLYGLLSLTFAQSEPTPEFYATPHWCLRQLGIVDPTADQGKRYAIFRDALRRLAGVVYENDRFYDPIRGEHRDVAFGFLKYSLPIDPESSRAWHIAWDPQFFKYCKAAAGSLRFDLEVYRELDCASRRLFLLLQKIFWRNEYTPAFEVRQLGVQTLGFSAGLETKKIKQKLGRIVQRLLETEVLKLPLGVATVNELFEKRGKGVHTLRLHRGPYFTHQQGSVTPSPGQSPLTEPLAAIGFESPAIKKILRTYPSSLVQQWTDITLAAMERGIVRESPRAYFMHYIREAAERRTTPPDWWREFRRQELFDATPSQPIKDPDTSFEEYLQTEAKEAFSRVTRRLFDKLREAGQSEAEAQSSAEYTARIHLRQEYRSAYPTADKNSPSRLGDLIGDRYRSDST